MLSYYFSIRKKSMGKNIFVNNSDTSNKYTATKKKQVLYMNHGLIITTSFLNTLGFFLLPDDRHLLIIRSLRKQKLDLAPNS